jgi:nucleoside-diphosphate-sugar epimerase
MQTVLVTGYGGFLGAAISRMLLASGYAVRGLARGDYPELNALGVTPIRGDITDRRSVQAAVAGCQAIIHTAAKAGVWGPWPDYYNVNTLATSLLLETAVAADCRVFVFTSSPSVSFAAANQSGVDESLPYPTRWLCHYPHTKALAEQSVLSAARSRRLLTCALRPHLIWGMGDPHLMPRVVDRAKSRRLRRVGAGTNRIDIVHVDNAARAHLLALERLLHQDPAVNGQAFFITDGVPIECWQWITRILRAADVTVPNKAISYPTAYRLGAMFELAYRIMRRQSEPPMTRFVAAQLALDHYFSIDKARRLLNYQPVQDLDNRLAACEAWLRSRP